ncbi:MAG: hypothetical protein NVSMB47_05090 [Polyangiales bacterium]
MRNRLTTPPRRTCPPLLRTALGGEPRPHTRGTRSIDAVMDSFWRPRAERSARIVDLASRRLAAAVRAEPSPNL